MNTIKYVEQAGRPFDPIAASAVYEREGLLSRESFFALLQDALRIRALELPELDWLLLDHLVTATHAPVPLEKHFEAIAAGYDLEFVGLEDLLRKMIDAEIVPAWTLNRTTFYRPPTGIEDLGDLFVGCGLLTETALERGRSMVMTILKETGVIASLGQILRSVSRVSTVDFFQVLGMRLGMPFESLDESAPAIHRAASQRATLTHRTKPQR